MNISSFLRQSAGKIKAAEFLQEHNDWLRNLHGCLVPKSAEQTKKDLLAYTKVQESISYILNQVQKRAMMPTPAITQIAHLLISLPAPPMGKPGKQAGPKKPGPVVIDADGNEIQEEVKEKEAKVSPYRYTILLYRGTLDHKTDPKNAPKILSMHQDEEQWKEKSYMAASGKADRLLYKNEDAIEAHIVGNEDGVITKITRGEAVARILRIGRPGPVCKPQIKSSKLGWGPRTHDYKQHFSKG